jgi:hypothetical protein
MDPKRRAAASTVGDRVIVPAPASDRRTRSISRENRPERSPRTPKSPTRPLCPGLISDHLRRHVATPLQSKTRLASERASQGTVVQNAFRGHDDQSGQGVNPRWTVFHMQLPRCGPRAGIKKEGHGSTLKSTTPGPQTRCRGCAPHRRTARIEARRRRRARSPRRQGAPLQAAQDAPWRVCRRARLAIPNASRTRPFSQRYCSAPARAIARSRWDERSDSASARGRFGTPISAAQRKGRGRAAMRQDRKRPARRAAGERHGGASAKASAPRSRPRARC